MSEELFQLPADLLAKIDTDYLLSVTRLIAGRTDSPSEFFMELDALLDIEPEKRTEAFRQMLAGLEKRLSAPTAPADDAGSIYF